MKRSTKTVCKRILLTCGMKEILIYGSQKVMVDDADYKHLNVYRWSLQKGKSTSYAVRYQVVDGKQKAFRMHRQIMEVIDQKQTIDHKDRNGLNNQRDNLRLCTPSQNMANRKKFKGSKSSYKGVFLDPSGTFYVMIKFNKKVKYIGRFKDEKKAAAAYNLAATEIYGEFAYLNKIQ